MMKKHILFVLLFAFVCIHIICPKSFANDLDEILNYEVTVEPRMNDGTLDITYKITWKVLDSTSEGPLEWVQIGTPNSYFDNPTAMTKNIKSITKYNDSYVKILFAKKYYAGEKVTFKYKIHQSHMYDIWFNECKYKYTPAWFTDAKVDKLTVKWNMDGVKSSNADSEEDNYLVWTKTNMKKGEKLNISVKYNKNAFGYLDESMQNTMNSEILVAVIVILIILIFIINMYGSGGGGYYNHRGFYGSGYHSYHYSSCACARSSCACARSSCACARSSCACACAGSGRAGCSKKDFYGTKINKDKLKKVLK